MAEEFDQAKAEKLIENLRAEVKQLKDDREPQADKDRRTIAALRRELDDLKPLAEKAKELEAAGKSSEQKVEERIASIEKRAQEAEARALRLEVATAKGLTSTQAKYLTGSSKEELETAADAILEDFGGSGGSGGDGAGGAGNSTTSTSGGGATTSRPKENLQGGGTATEEPEETDPRKLAASIPRG